MTTLASAPQIDGQWIDYYAILDVPAGADEDSIRRRIGKVYAEAAANSEHRDMARRRYFQALVERVLPQCRRVLLDAEWRARYDAQHALHQSGSETAQNYVAFIASMRGGDVAEAARGDGATGFDESLLPQRAQDDINAAREVVQTALSGAELELLPSRAVSQRASATPPQPYLASAGEMAQLRAIEMPDSADDYDAPVAPRGKKRRNINNAPIPQVAATASGVPATAASAFDKTPHASLQATIEPVGAAPLTPAFANAPMSLETSASAGTPLASAPISVTNALGGEFSAGEVSTREQPGEPARAKVITAQEAADIRRRRASNPNVEPFVGPASREVSARNNPRSRVSVEADDPALRRKLSPTSLNLMVAITGVLLTITIQRFAATPAIATSSGRTPIVLAVAPEMQVAIANAGAAWQKTPAGAAYDIVVDSADSSAVLQRSLSKSADLPDAWIPASASYAQRYNQLAPAAGRPTLQIGDSLAQTPLVLVARADRAGALRLAFPDHKIGKWDALRDTVKREANGRFGLSDPRQSVPGAIARFSMAREWGQTRGQSPEAAAKNGDFWKWMNGFEENIPSSAPSPDAMVKDMVLGTTGRFWWAVSYESDALDWVAQGKPLELFYLPRTALADHPFCSIERVGAPVEVAGGRAAFAEYLRSAGAQKALLQSGFRPTEISPATPMDKNPFLGAGARARGVQLQGLPRDERFNVGALGIIGKKWSEFYG